MNLNSPVKVLHQEVKTPLIPDSEMCTETSTMGSAEDKRKAGPDALAAPDAKKKAISDASTGRPKGDKAAREVSSPSTGFSLFFTESELLEFDEENYKSSDSSDDEEDEDKDVIYDTTFGDMKPLEDALALVYDLDSEKYKEVYKQLRRRQLSFEEKVSKGRDYSGKKKMRAEFALNKEGQVGYHILETIE